MVSLVPLPVFAGHLESLDVSNVSVPKAARCNGGILKSPSDRVTQLQNTASIKARMLAKHLHCVCGSRCASCPTDRERGSEAKAKCGNLFVVAICM